MVSQYNNGSPPQKIIAEREPFLAVSQSFINVTILSSSSESGFNANVFFIGFCEQCRQVMLQAGPNNKNTADSLSIIIRHHPDRRLHHRIVRDPNCYIR